MNRKKTIAIAAFFLIAYTVKGFLMTDPDLGWHIKTGELILAGGIPKTDPFSYTMSNYLYIDHSWLMSAAVAYFLPYIGLFGLSFVFSVMAVAAFVIQHKGSGEKGLFPFCIGLFISLPFAGIRSQIISWLFFSALLLLLNQRVKQGRLGYLVLPLMLIWANFHGGFVIGILSLLIYLMVGFFTGKEDLPYRWGMFLGSIVISLCNPYGPSIWTEVYRTAFNSNLRFTIGEWRPAAYFMHPSFYLYIGLFLALVIKYFHRRKNPFLLAMSGFLLVNAMLGVRNIPLWLLTAQKVWGEYYPRLAKEVGSGKEQKRRFNRAKKIITGIFILLFCIQAYSYTVSMLAQQEEKTYPKKAIEYLKKNPKEGNLFSEYGWGGYLIWKYPEKKTFVDGRMAIWRWNQKDKRFLNDAYGTYLDIMNGEKTLIPYLQKYHITRLILPTPQKTTVHPIILKLRALLQPRGKTILKINYPIEYQDETATIYKTN